MVLIRPDAIQLSTDGEYQLSGTVQATTFRGSLCRVEVAIQGISLTFDFPSSVRLPKPGEQVRISFIPDKALLVLPQTE